MTRATSGGARPERARGQALATLGTVVALIAAFVALDRAGAKDPLAAPPGRAPSGAWVCPHGGADGWTVALFLANPSDESSSIRLTELGREAPGRPELLEVPAGGTARVDLEPRGRDAATFVEYFGGWIGAGWVTSSEGGAGTAAEPCAAEPSRRWLLPDGTTRLEEEASVVVANPFDADAVIDVAIYTADRAPIRDSEWTDLNVPGGRSLTLRLNEKVEGEPVVAVELRVSVGRVVAASLGVTDDTRIRSALGWTGGSTNAIYPVMQSSGQTELVILSTADASLQFGATSLTEAQPRPAAGLTEQQHGPAAARAYAIPVEGGPEGIEIFTLEGATVAGAVRAIGPGRDPGATAGARAPAPAWVVLPAGAAGGGSPGVVLVNPSGEDAVATVEILEREGAVASTPITVDVPARAAAAVPPDLLASAPGSAVLVRTDGPEIVALAATTSPGDDDEDTFALSLGVPVPQRL